jgi:hypothetical protein
MHEDWPMRIGRFAAVLCILVAAAVLTAHSLAATPTTPTTAKKVDPCVSAGRAAFPVRKLPSKDTKLPAKTRARIARIHDRQLEQRRTFIRGCLHNGNTTADSDAAYFLLIAALILVALLAVPLLFDVIAIHLLRRKLANYASKDRHFTKAELVELIDKPLSGVRGLARASMALAVLAVLGLALFYLIAKRPFTNSSALADHVLTILGTLATAITAFYFGSRTAESSSEMATRAALDPGRPKDTALVVTQPPDQTTPPTEDPEGSPPTPSPPTPPDN